ncbi:hypothetical protein [Flavobacterium sp.]|uniref:hypothetical protein n=1 Tax=Flavobacterium sp. TaxID=239 RepID=UPI003B9AA923
MTNSNILFEEKTKDALQWILADSDPFQELKKRKSLKRNQFDFFINESNVTDHNFIYELLTPTIDSASSSENKINGNREEHLRKIFTPKFLTLIKEEDFEFGFTSRSEELIRSQLKINALATRNWLNEIFINYFDNEVVLIGLLRVISRFEENIIFPQGQTIALAALSHSNDEIKELGIRSFEKWCSVDSLNILRKLNLNSSWLQEYVNEVITDLEEQLCLS